MGATPGTPAPWPDGVTCTRGRSFRPARPRQKPDPPSLPPASMGSLGPPSRARPIAADPASGPVPHSYWPACRPRRCLSGLSRRSLAPPGPPRKFEKKKSFMGGWKGPGQRRGREGPEEWRPAAERGGGGGIPAPLSPTREPFPPFYLLLSPPRVAVMTVSDTPPPGQPLRAPGGGESDGPSPASPLLGSSLLTSRRREVSAGRLGDPSGRAGRPTSPSPSLLLTFPGQEPGRP